MIHQIHICVVAKFISMLSCPILTWARLVFQSSVLHSCALKYSLGNVGLTVNMDQISFLQCFFMATHMLLDLLVTNQIIEKCLKKNNEEILVHSNKFVGFPHAWLNLYHRNHFYICIASDPHSKKKSEVTRLKEIKECVYDSLGYLFETGWQEICRTCLNIGVSEQTTKSKSKQIGGNKKYLHPAGRTPVFITFCINHF